MMNIKPFLPIFFALCAFCPKDSHSNLEQILLEGTWLHSGYYIDANNDGIFEEASLPCQIGDGWKFTADHKFELRDEIEYCNADLDSVSIINGTWELQNNDTEIFITMESSFQDFNFQLVFINDTIMKLRLFNLPSTQAPPEERIVLRR